MLEHCITFFKEEPNNDEADTVVFHCHVSADNEMFAVEGALRGAIASNVSLAGATGVEVKVVLDLPVGLVESMEALRIAQHGAKAAAAPQAPASAHLH